VENNTLTSFSKLSLFQDMLVEFH